MSTPLYKRLTALLIVAALSTAATAQKLYRWVDEDGNVHYSDQVPPEAQDRPRDQVNSSGRVVESDEGMPDEGELQLSPEELERQQQLIAQDEALARKYASEDDILQAKQRKIAGMDLTIQHAEAFLDGQKPNLDSLLERKAKVESEGGKISEALESMIDDLSRQLAEQRSKLDKARVDREETMAFYDQELSRYRDMQSRKQGQQADN
jgi:hypothetical protein